MKRYFTLLFVGAFLPIMVTAQEQEKQPTTSHYFHLLVGGGLHSQDITNSFDLDNKFGGGALLELQYQYIPNHWGLGLGVQLSYLNSNLQFPKSYETDYILNNANRTLVHMAKINEVNHLLMVEIPIQAFCLYPIADNWQINAGLGLNIGFPIYGQHNIGSKQYYVQESYLGSTTTNAWQENPLFDDVKKDLRGKTTYKLPTIGLQADLGFIYQFAPKYALYFGVYANYDVLNTYKYQETELYSSSDAGILNSSHVSQIRPFEAGVKIGFRFHLKDARRERESQEAEALRQAEEERQQALAKEEEERQAAIKAEEERLARERTEAERQQAIKEEQLRKEQEAKEQEDLTLALDKSIVYFNHNQAIVQATPGTDEGLADIQKYLQKHPDKHLVIIGHTCDMGEEDYNNQLGLIRAESYKAYCIKQGLDGSRLDVQTKGKSEPIATNADIEGRSKNRRISLRIE